MIRIILDACAGLHAAHTLADEKGKPLNLIHRDVSPQNIIVGVDGMSRLTDFGIAKCSETSQGSTGILKGKAGYMAPEYVDGHQIDRRVDVFGLGVVLWEALARRRLFEGRNQADTLFQVINARIPPLSSLVPEVGPGVSRVVAKALERSPGRRFQDAEQFAAALEEAATAIGLVAPHSEVGVHARAVVGEELDLRRKVVEQVVNASDVKAEDVNEATSRRDRRDHPRPADMESQASTFSGSGSTASRAHSLRGRRLWASAGLLAVVAGVFIVSTQRTSGPLSGAVPQPPQSAEEPSASVVPAISVSAPPVISLPEDAGGPTSAGSAQDPAGSVSVAVGAPKPKVPARVPRAATASPPASTPARPASTPSEPDKAPPNPYGTPH